MRHDNLLWKKVLVSLSKTITIECNASINNRAIVERNLPYNSPFDMQAF